jgi:hypothetical protein
MNHVRSVLAWCKENPITVICAAVVILAGASFFWPTWAWASAFRGEVASRSSEISRISSLTSSSITIPPPQADGEAIRHTGVINDAQIEALGKVYERILEEYDGVRQFVVQHNQQGHTVMMDGLFPEPLARDASFNAQKAYVEQFILLYESLNAADVMSREERDEIIRKELERYERQLFGAKLEGEHLTEANRQAAEKLQRTVKERAQRFKIYAPKVSMVAGSSQQAERNPGPFHVEPWAFELGAPKTEPMWEGQMQLWIQQDLVRVLRLANNMDDPEANITNQPVKVLEWMQVVPEYIGMESSASARGAGGGGFGEEAPSVPASIDVAAYEQALREGVRPDRRISVTGRKSNPLYDVRHAEMSLIIDYNRLPELLNALSQINFMTLLDMKLFDVDEYEMFREGYYFGNRIDAWRVWLKIETVWMRDWTAGTYMTRDQIDAARRDGKPVDEGLMPESVRLRLRLPLRRPERAADALAQQEKAVGGGRTPGMGVGQGAGTGVRPTGRQGPGAFGR